MAVNAFRLSAVPDLTVIQPALFDDRELAKIQGEPRLRVPGGWRSGGAIFGVRSARQRWRTASTRQPAVRRGRSRLDRLRAFARHNGANFHGPSSYGLPF